MTTFTTSELEEFVPEVNKMSGLSEKVFVFFNNFATWALRP